MATPTFSESRFDVILINALWGYVISFSGFDESGVRAKRYEYNELRTATKNFAEDRKLGEGAFGAVYKVQILPSIYFLDYTLAEFSC